MSVKVIAEFNCSEGNADKFIQVCRNAFPETRKYAGCEGIDISIDEDDGNHLVMTENWTSKEHHQAYLKFRTEEGTLGKLKGLLSGPPKFSYFNLTDV